MWIRRADYQRLVDDLADVRDTRDRTARSLATETAKREVLAQQLGIRQQNVDWLMAHVNRLELERATLLDRVLRLTLPVPVIAREPADHPDLAAALGVGRPIETRDREPGDPIGVAASALGLSSFEDVGDQTATALGIRHDAAGNVLYQ